MPQQIAIKWDGTRAEIAAPANPQIDKRRIDLTSSNYTAVIATRPDFKANAASDWVSKLFAEKTITACSVQYGNRIFLTPSFAGKGPDSKKKAEGFEQMVQALRAASGLEVAFHPETVKEARRRSQRRNNRDTGEREGLLAAFIDGAIDVLTFAWLVDLFDD